MMKLFKKYWKDPVWSKVIATFLIAVISFLLAYFTNNLHHIVNFFYLVGDFLVAKTFIANWILILLSFSLLLVIVIIIAVLRERYNNSGLPYKGYIMDSFLGLKWKWSYSDNGALENIHSFCPQCDYQIIPRFSDSPRVGAYSEYVCDDCGYLIPRISKYPEQINQQITLKIQKKIRMDNWKKH